MQIRRHSHGCPDAVRYHQLCLQGCLSNCYVFTMVTMEHHGCVHDSQRVNYQHLVAKPFWMHGFDWQLHFPFLPSCLFTCCWWDWVVGARGESGGSVVLTTPVGKLGCLWRGTEWSGEMSGEGGWEVGANERVRTQGKKYRGISRWERTARERKEKELQWVKTVQRVGLYMRLLKTRNSEWSKLGE